MESLIPLLIGLGSGAVGGNVAGKVMNSGMGTLGRSLTGIVGGAGLSFVLQQFGIGAADPTAGAGLNPMAIISNVASGGVGGGILTFILGKVMGNKG